MPVTEFTSDSIFGLVGAGGFGREVMPLVREVLAHGSDASIRSRLYFVETSPEVSSVNGYNVLSTEEFQALEAEAKFFNVAIADSGTREVMAEALISSGAKPLSLAADSSTMLDEVDIGEGSILCANTSVTSNVRIGKFFHSNLYSYVAHDCVIGDYVTLAPRVSINGNVHVGNHAYIGTGAVIRPGTSERPITIGAGALVGMGAIVNRSVEPGTTVVGNPARVMRRPR